MGKKKVAGNYGSIDESIDSVATLNKMTIEMLDSMERPQVEPIADVTIQDAIRILNNDVKELIRRVAQIEDTLLELQPGTRIERIRERLRELDNT